MKVLDMRFLILAFVLGSGLGTWAAWQWQAAHYGLQLSTQTLAWQQEREQAALAVVDWQNAEQARRRALEQIGRAHV